jgi:hypothetical protein
MRTLIIAYGNTDRQDDGVAWAVLRELAVELGGEFPATPQECSERELQNADLRCMPINPKLRMISIAIEGRLHRRAYRQCNRISTSRAQQPAILPLTHHLTPASCLAIAQPARQRACATGFGAWI